MRRKLTMISIGVAVLMTVLYACKKDKKNAVQEFVTEKCLNEGTGQSTIPYNIYLYKITDNGNGTYTWEWRIKNLNPGNGSGGTAANLNGWNISLGACIKATDIVSGATSTDGTTWNSFAPTIAVDNGQSCFTDKVIKFDLGTTGSNISYYRLTVNKNVSHNTVTGVFKTSEICGSLETCGFGCE